MRQCMSNTIDSDGTDKADTTRGATIFNDSFIYLQRKIAIYFPGILELTAIWWCLDKLFQERVCDLFMSQGLLIDFGRTIDAQ